MLSKALMDQKLGFNKNAFVMTIEFTKFVLALSVHFIFPPKEWKDRSPSFVAKHLIASFSQGIWLAGAAGIYIFYNVFQYVNLSYYDPGTYRVLINVRVLFTGLLTEWFFGKKLGKHRWIALGVLLMGCGVGQLKSGLDVAISFGLVTMCIQALASSFGGVYFSWILQKEKVKLSFWEKNIYMYFWGFLLNLIYCVMFHPEALTGEDFEKYTSVAWWTILFAAGGGFSTAMLLKYISPVLKEFANAFEMIVLAVSQSLILGTEFNVIIFVAIGLVVYALHLYNKPNPEDVKDTNPAPQEEQKPLMGGSDLNQSVASKV
eukprot:TRINITY_DN781955_c0_g1_i1.p1 TRINITY_DN781955_c0_g1~~TRINITY_DN781955_c0_g1_i1.p1  ORF type:complete len:372 (-),score=72.70 TRINITY_DN781955_c0_g1_i1:180-1133(-)